LKNRVEKHSCVTLLYTFITPLKSLQAASLLDVTPVTPVTSLRERGRKKQKNVGVYNQS
jgi:hypothetical protein